MANSKMHELAGKINSMKNPAVIGISIGTVVKTDPFTVTVAGEQVILVEGDELFVCRGLKEQTYEDASWEWEDGTLTASISGTTSVEGESVSGTVDNPTSGSETGTLIIDPGIKPGDLVLVVPTADEQTWIAVDRIEVST